MSLSDILSASTTRAIASPGVGGTESAVGRRHAYAIRSVETLAWGTFRGKIGHCNWEWAVRLEDATVFSCLADARLAAQSWFPLDRTEVVRVNLPLQSRPSEGEKDEDTLPLALALAFSEN